MSYTLDDSKYVILINDDNTMTTTQKRRIVQRSKLVDDLWFLVRPEYNGYSMADFTVLLEYLSPISRKYRTEFLVMDDEDYNGYLRYSLPVNTSITAEAGEIEIQITFLRSELTDSGKGTQRVRKITSTMINIVPISAWSDIIPDCALTALDQRIIKMDAQIKALNETTIMISDAKADNISYNEENNELQLLSGTTPIGNKVILSNVGIDEDGMPVVDFTGTTSNPDAEDKPGDSGASGGGSGNSGSSDSEEDNSSDIVEF